MHEDVAMKRKFRSVLVVLQRDQTLWQETNKFQVYLTSAQAQNMSDEQIVHVNTLPGDVYFHKRGQDIVWTVE